MPKIFIEHAKNIPETEKKRRLNFCLGYCTKSWKYFVSRLMLLSAISPLLLCVYNFVFKSIFLLADRGIRNG